jgi:hypothetical protein
LLASLDGRHDSVPRIRDVKSQASRSAGLGYGMKF